jgi:hypothetical protein
LRRIAERTLNRPVAVTISHRMVILRAEAEGPGPAGPARCRHPGHRSLAVAFAGGRCGAAL